MCKAILLLYQQAGSNSMLYGRLLRLFTICDGVPEFAWFAVLKPRSSIGVDSKKVHENKSKIGQLFFIAYLDYTQMGSRT